MLGAPVPTFPAVRIPYLLSEAAHLIQKQCRATVCRVNEHAFAMSVTLHQDCKRAILSVDTFDFGSNEIRRFIP